MGPATHSHSWLTPPHFADMITDQGIEALYPIANAVIATPQSTPARRTNVVTKSTSCLSSACELWRNRAAVAVWFGRAYLCGSAGEWQDSPARARNTFCVSHRVPPSLRRSAPEGVMPGCPQPRQTMPRVFDKVCTFAALTCVTSDRACARE